MLNLDKLRLELIELARLKKKIKKKTFAGSKYTHKSTYCHFVIKNIKLWLLKWKKKGHMIHQINLSKKGTRTAMALSLFSHYLFDLLLALF